MTHRSISIAHASAEARNRLSRPASRSRTAGAVWHSQTTITPQPSRRSRPIFRWSRATLRVNFSRQNRRFAAGVDRPRGHSRRCQKQPWTKITLRREANTRSGRPGSIALCNRKRKPSPCASRLTTISGAVCFPRTAAIMRLRVALSKQSRIAGNPIVRENTGVRLLKFLLSSTMERN